LGGFVYMPLKSECQTKLGKELRFISWGRKFCGLLAEQMGNVQFLCVI